MHVRFANSLSLLTLVIGLLFGLGQPAQAQTGYTIRSGDVLQVEVLEDNSLNRSVLVLPNGTLSFPMAGTLTARGRTVEQISDSLTAALAPSFAAPPTVFVSVGQLAAVEEPANRMIDIYAIGEFAEPGRKEVKPGTTLLQFLAEAGGLGRFAADKRIELHRTNPQTGQVSTFLFNYRLPAGGAGRISGGTRLTAGDVVNAPQRRLFE